MKYTQPIGPYEVTTPIKLPKPVAFVAGVIMMAVGLIIMPFAMMIAVFVAIVSALLWQIPSRRFRLFIAHWVELEATLFGKHFVISKEEALRQ